MKILGVYVSIGVNWTWVNVKQEFERQAKSNDKIEHQCDVTAIVISYYNSTDSSFLFCNALSGDVI